MIIGANTNVGGIDNANKLNLHFNNNFVDSEIAGTAKTITNHSNRVTFDATNFKFGIYSALFDQNDATYLTTPSHADFNVGSGDFTIDLWFKRGIDTSADTFLFGQNNSTFTVSTLTLRSEIYGGGIYFGVGVSSTQYFSANSITLDKNWHHAAYVRYGNTITTYLDGISLTTKINILTNSINTNNTNPFTIGRCGDYPSLTWNGNIDEFRFTKGLARWTSDFPNSLPKKEYTKPKILLQAA